MQAKGLFLNYKENPNTHICQYNTVITADKFRK